MSTALESLPSGVALGLVGDIGGTNCRLALATEGADGPCLFRQCTLKCADYPTAEDGIRHYLEWAQVKAPSAAVLAAAGPVLHGRAHLTNAVWDIDEAALQSALGIPRVRVVNDFAVQAYAMPILRGADLVTIGAPSSGQDGGTVVIMGPGTGFGLAALAGGRDEGLVVAEAGHIGFAPTGEDEIDILRILMRRYGRVSVERVLSGHGMENLHNARAELAGAPPPGMDAAAITEAAEHGDPYATATVRKLCDIMAAVAGDFALAFGAQGGVFVGGGILPRLLPHLDHAAFRARFETKGRFVGYLKAIPVHVVVAGDASLRGAGRAWAVLAR
jgi:glucokinase